MPWKPGGVQTANTAPITMVELTQSTSKFLVLAIWLVFAGFLLAQHQLVFPYHDDWGYAVLSYTTEQTGFTGQDFTFDRLLAFIGAEYTHWSGRVAAFFFQIQLFKLGLTSVRLYQFASILAILALAVLIPAKPRQPFWVYAVPPLLYLALPEHVLVGGVYWFSAAAGYLWGLAFLLGAAWLLKRDGQAGLGACLLLSLTALFHELLAIAALAFAFTWVIMLRERLRSKGALIRYALFLLPVLLCAAICVLAPGNFKRKSVSTYASEHTLDIVLSNLNAMTHMWTSLGSLAGGGVLVGAWVALWRHAPKHPGSGLRVLRDYGTLVGAVLCFALLAAPAPYSSAAPVIFAALFASSLYRVCTTHSAGAVVFSLYVAALASLAPLLLSPGVPGRALIPFDFLMFVPVIFALSNLQGLAQSWLAGLAACLVLFVAKDSALNIYRGYQRNELVQVANDAKLRALSLDIENGVSVARGVSLYKLPDPRYAETMPYDRPLIERWIRKFYRLPPGLEFNWQNAQP